MICMLILFPHTHERKLWVYLHRLDVSQYQCFKHVDVGVLADHIGFSMMLKVSMVPPVCRGPLFYLQHKNKNIHFSKILNKNVCNQHF